MKGWQTPYVAPPLPSMHFTQYNYVLKFDLHGRFLFSDAPFMLPHVGKDVVKSFEADYEQSASEGIALTAQFRKPVFFKAPVSKSSEAVLDYGWFDGEHFINYFKSAASREEFQTGVTPPSWMQDKHSFYVDDNLDVFNCATREGFILPLLRQPALVQEDSQFFVLLILYCLKWGTAQYVETKTKTGTQVHFHLSKVSNQMVKVRSSMALLKWKGFS